MDISNFSGGIETVSCSIGGCVGPKLLKNQDFGRQIVAVLTGEDRCLVFSYRHVETLSSSLACRKIPDYIWGAFSGTKSSFKSSFNPHRPRALFSMQEARGAQYWIEGVPILFAVHWQSFEVSLIPAPTLMVDVTIRNTEWRLPGAWSDEPPALYEVYDAGSGNAVDRRLIHDFWRTSFLWSNCSIQRTWSRSKSHILLRNISEIPTFDLLGLGWII